jgi:hypothetical protein
MSSEESWFWSREELKEKFNYESSDEINREAQKKYLKLESGFYYPRNGWVVVLLGKKINLKEDEFENKGGVLVTHDQSERSESMKIINQDYGQVISIAPDCFLSKDGFKAGPACRIGDWVDVPSQFLLKKDIGDYHCARFQQKYLIAVTEDPESLRSVFVRSADDADYTSNPLKTSSEIF